MSRRHRVQYCDAIYHVTSRGVNRGDIFFGRLGPAGFSRSGGRNGRQIGMAGLRIRLDEQPLPPGLPHAATGSVSRHAIPARTICPPIQPQPSTFGGPVRGAVSLPGGRKRILFLDGQSLRASQSRAPTRAASGRVALVQLRRILRSETPLALGAIRRLAGGVARGVRRNRRRVCSVCRSAAGSVSAVPFPEHADGWILGSDSEHTAFMPAIIQINSGEASLTIGGEAVSGKPGAWLHMLAKMPHSVKAQTPVVMLLLK